VSSCRLYYLGNGNYLASYTIRVPQRYLVPALVDSKQKWDATFSVLATLEQHCSAYDVPGGRAVSTDQYRAGYVSAREAVLSRIAERISGYCTPGRYAWLPNEEPGHEQAYRRNSEPGSPTVRFQWAWVQKHRLWE